MKLSKYTLVKEGYPKDGFALLYNTLRKGISIIDENNLFKITNGSVDSIESSIIENLMEEGFIVNKNDDEISKLNMYFTTLKSSYYAYATMILTSYDCNMRCSYCFENGIKDRQESMSLDTAKSTVAWLKEELLRYQPKNVGIAFSGGEPLINKEVIELIIIELKQFCDVNNMNFSFGFLTNGTIPIDKEEASLFCNNGLSFIQYTIDGNKTLHEKRRYMKGGSYNKILNNIKNNYELMNMETIIRVNVDKENKDAIDELLSDVQKLNIKKITFDFANRFETFHDVYGTNENVLDSKEFAATIKEYFKKTKDISFSHSRRYSNNSPCLAIVPRQFVIDPIGDLYKCAAFAGEKEFVVGSIYDSEMNDVYIDMVGLDPWHECKNCKFVPLCGGGCMWLNRNASSDYKQRLCQYELFNELVMDTLLSTLNKEQIINQLEGV